MQNGPSRTKTHAERPDPILLRGSVSRGIAAKEIAQGDKQALVLVNRGGCTFDEIVQLANAIIADVEARFGVTLQREVIFNE